MVGQSDLLASPRCVRAVSFAKLAETISLPTASGFRGGHDGGEEGGGVFSSISKTDVVREGRSCGRPRCEDERGEGEKIGYVATDGVVLLVSRRTVTAAGWF